MILKYIIVRNEYCAGVEKAILFDMDLVHAHIAKCHRAGRLVVVSAGFVEINGYNVRTYGFSESLGMSSRPQDALVVSQAVMNDCDDSLNSIVDHVDIIDKLVADGVDGKLSLVRDFLVSLLPKQLLDDY